MGFPTQFYSHSASDGKSVCNFNFAYNFWTVKTRGLILGIFSGKTFPWVPTILTLGVWPTFLKLTLVITFDQWVLELWYFTWMFPVARPFCVYSHFYPVTLTLELDPFLYPTQRVAEGIMFLTRPSVSQSCFSC